MTIDPGAQPQLFDHHLGFLVARAHKGLRREFEARLVEHDVTVPQVRVLMSLWQEDGIPISQLTNHACSDGPTLTSLLDRLESKGLIYRERDVHDRRVVRIFLHDRGRSLQNVVDSAGEAVINVVRDGITGGKVDQLCDLLRQLCETLENYSSRDIDSERFEITSTSAVR